MSKTKIEWTDRVWNPVRGCSRISRGCENCYAERIAARFSGADEIDENGDPGKAQPFFGFARRAADGPRWTGRVELLEDKLTEPLRWRRWAERFLREHGRRPRCFVNSMSDLFHEALPDEAIDRVFAVMALCPQVTFQVLTKRAERMREWAALSVCDDTAARRVHVSATACFLLDELGEMPDGHPSENWFDVAPWLEPSSPYMVRWPLPNVWLGVSVEDQPTADERIPELLATPAAARFVSYEPALGLVDWGPWLPRRLPLDQVPGHLLNDGITEVYTGGLDWIIAGGESGPGARPANPDWFRDVRDQCAAAGVAFFMKQITERGRKVAFEEWPQDLRVREFPNAR